MSFLPSGSFTQTWSSRQTSFAHLAIWPSTIFGITASGLPDCFACSKRIDFYFSSTAGGISSCVT